MPEGGYLNCKSEMKKATGSFEKYFLERKHDKIVGKDKIVYIKQDGIKIAFIGLLDLNLKYTIILTKIKDVPNNMQLAFRYILLSFAKSGEHLSTIDSIKSIYTKEVFPNSYAVVMNEHFGGMYKNKVKRTLQSENYKEIEYEHEMAGQMEWITNFTKRGYYIYTEEAFSNYPEEGFGESGDFARLEFKLEDKTETTTKLLIDSEYENRLRDYLGVPILPKPGDPLINMEIVHLSIDGTSGGTFGCVRTGENNCQDIEIPLMPSLSGKVKVYDGFDLKAELNTPVYSFMMARSFLQLGQTHLALMVIVTLEIEF